MSFQINLQGAVKVLQHRDCYLCTQFPNCRLAEQTERNPEKEGGTFSKTSLFLSALTESCL